VLSFPSNFHNPLGLSFPSKHQNTAGLLWYSVMNQIHNKLEPSNFSNLLNSNLTRITICDETGLYATDNCKNTYSEYFLKGTVPEVCNKH